MKPSPFDEDTFLRFFRTLDERQARLCAAERALVIGRGGITLVSRVTGLSYPTIHKEIAELRSTAVPLAIGRIRRPGGGRKKVEVVDPAVLPILQEVVESSTAGSPTDVLRWTSKSKTNLAVALAGRGTQNGAEHRWPPVARAGLQLASKSERQGRSIAPGAGSAGGLPKRPGASVSGARPAGYFRRHKKEGAGGRLQECRPHVAAEGTADPSADPRLSVDEYRQGCPVWDLRRGL